MKDSRSADEFRGSPSAPAAERSPVRRSSVILCWVFISAPLVFAVVWLAIGCTAAYKSGSHFVQGLHGLGWVMWLFFGAVPFAAMLLISAATIVAGRKWLKGRSLLWVAVALPVCSLIIPLGALPLMQTSFFQGRHRAYAALEYSGIRSACLELRDRLGVKQDLMHIERDSEAFNSLPPAIRDLKPLSVCVAPAAVVIQMDGGGPMYHEGIGVVFADIDEKRFVESSGAERLHPTLPVYLYRLYDYRQFFDYVQEAAKTGHDG